MGVGAGPWGPRLCCSAEFLCCSRQERPSLQAWAGIQGRWLAVLVWEGGSAALRELGTGGCFPEFLAPLRVSSA